MRFTDSHPPGRAHDARKPAAALPGLSIAQLECAPFRVVRLRSHAGGFGMLPELPASDTYLVAIKLRPLDEYDLFLSERHNSRAPIAAGGLCMVHPEAEARLNL